MEKQKYQTKQSKQVLAFLQERAGEHTTAQEVCDYFKKQEEPISAATVYRQLDRLAQEGELLKFTTDSAVCYEFQPSDVQAPIHCKCEVCGDLLHLVCDEFQELEQHISNHHQFKISSQKTVLYGVCEACQ